MHNIAKYALAKFINIFKRLNALHVLKCSLCYILIYFQVVSCIYPVKLYLRFFYLILYCRPIQTGIFFTYTRWIF